MPEVDDTVRVFVEERLIEDDAAEIALEELFEYVPNGPPRERFRWHVEQCLPDGVETAARPDGVYLVGARIEGVPTTL